MGDTAIYNRYRRAALDGAGAMLRSAREDFDVSPNGELSGLLTLLANDPGRLGAEYYRQSRGEGLSSPASVPDVGRVLFENRVYRWALQSQIRSQAARMEQLLLRAIRTLAHALEARDAYTGGHSARVSQYAAGIARQLELSAAEIAAISLGGELHDIGKIGVPDDLLRKPGPLTPEEYRQVMEHTIIGTHILYPLFHQRSDVLSIVRSHHERLDGKSLPDGLKGDGIPLAARIVAVADAFDAMTSGRPYRLALTARAALAELERGAGSQFDEDCVRAFCRCSRQVERREGSGAVAG